MNPKKEEVRIKLPPKPADSPESEQPTPEQRAQLEAEELKRLEEEMAEEEMAKDPEAKRERQEAEAERIRDEYRAQHPYSQDPPPTRTPRNPSRVRRAVAAAKKLWALAVILLLLGVISWMGWQMKHTTPPISRPGTSMAAGTGGGSHVIPPIPTNAPASTATNPASGSTVATTPPAPTNAPASTVTPPPPTTSTPPPATTSATNSELAQLQKQLAEIQKQLAEMRGTNGASGTKGNSAKETTDSHNADHGNVVDNKPTFMFSPTFAPTIAYGGPAKTASASNDTSSGTARQAKGGDQHVSLRGSATVALPGDHGRSPWVVMDGDPHQVQVSTTGEGVVVHYASAMGTTERLTPRVPTNLLGKSFWFENIDPDDTEVNIRSIMFPN